MFNKLKKRKPDTPDLAYMSHLPIGIHGKRPGLNAEVKSVERFNATTSARFFSRPPIEYQGSQPDSQQSYLTQSQSTQQFSQNSAEDLAFASNPWRYGSTRGRDFNSKPLASPSPAARPSQFQHCSKDGSNFVLNSPATAQNLLEQISNRSHTSGKHALTEQMERRLIAIENGLSGIMGRLAELQTNLLSLEATIKEGARESEVSRKKAALQQHVLQSLVDMFENWKRGEAVYCEMEALKREELSDQVKRFPTRIVEQITELKDELFESLKPVWQRLLNFEPKATSICNKEIDGHLRVDDTNDKTNAGISLQPGTRPRPAQGGKCSTWSPKPGPLRCQMTVSTYEQNFSFNAPVNDEPQKSQQITVAKNPKTRSEAQRRGRRLCTLE